MSRTYKLKVAGLERELPLCEVNDELEIAAFIMLSDVELTIACARELLKKCPDFDCILTAETKGIPIAYEAARQSGKGYIVARKSMKVYMQDAVMVNVNSITTKEEQTLYLSRKDSDTMKGKRV
ncbi:MAG: adenine phosphoribosyltransferase, partial [Ruminococcus sp.]|nr:adenine phosphoribosyltransferase [Ruminococcus sp.]